MSRVPVEVWETTARLFPDISSNQVFEATGDHWVFVGDVPLPREWAICPLCDHDLVFRWWRWHERGIGTTNRMPTVKHRCDVAAKCRGCALLFYFGVALTEDQWENRPWPKQDKRQISYRLVRDHLRKIGAP